MNSGPHHHAGYWADKGIDVPHPSASDATICSSTITYMLDGSKGIGSDVALIAQFAGLARERNRTFIIMDQQWNRGKCVLVVVISLTSR